MVKRYYDVGVAIFRFLKAARNRAKEGMSKEQILDFARREFGEVSKLLRKQIDDLFKKGTPSKSKIGEFFGFKNYPKTAQKKKGEVVPFKKEEGIMAADAATEIVKKKIDLSKYDDDALNALAVEGNRIKTKLDELGKSGTNYEEFKKLSARKKEIDDILSAAQDIPASGIGSFKADMELSKISDEAKKAADIAKKRTEDIAEGDPTGEVSEIMEGLASIKHGGKGLDPREGVVRAAAREILNKNKIKIGKEDPIDLLRKTYGEAGLDALDAIGDDLLNTQTYGEMNDLLTKNKLFNLKAKKVPGYDKSIQDAEELRILDEFDPKDRTPNADGGLIDILKL